jgi:diaminohydroxyphosphoribosylaminopyrimidine deaminase/5-amino-6-(5-phosphoribosylamino)uracil reductase
VNQDSSVNEKTAPDIIFTHNHDVFLPHAEKVKLDKNVSSSLQIAGYLFRSGIQSLFIEGGATVLNHFISSGIWDEAKIFTGTALFKDGIKAPVINGDLYSKSIFSKSELEIYINAS